MQPSLQQAEETRSPGVEQPTSFTNQVATLKKKQLMSLWAADV